MAVVTFYGVVVAYGSSRDSTPELAVCCASRITGKKFRVISLEGSFEDEKPDFKPEPGQLVSGKARILYVWDGSILVKFLGKELKPISMDDSNNFDPQDFKYVYYPRAKREIVLAGRSFYNFRLDHHIFPNQLSWNKNDTPFTKLALQFLIANGSSMAFIEGDAFFFSWVTNKKIEKSIFFSLYERRSKQTSRNGNSRNFAKAAIFLLLSNNEEAHTPIFILANCEGIKLEKGRLYHFKNLPLIYNNDTLPVWAMYEAESTLFCGKGYFELAENMASKNLISLYDELSNVYCMPTWLWDQYFKERVDKGSLLNWIDGIRRKIKQQGVSISNIVHGWWYHWSHETTLNIKGQETYKIAILATDFKDGGPSRIIILPEDIYMKNRFKFPEYGTAVSVSENPQILDGLYQPNPVIFETIKEWIILNHKSLIE